MNLFKALKSLDRYKLFKVFHYCKTGSYAELLEKTKNYISKFNELNNIELDQLIPPKGRKYEKLRFKLEAKPMVSIVIPVYNKWHYTYNCLEYIQKYTDDVAYEVIIGDDVSTDETRNAEKYLDNVIISRNEKNCGFLKNCNKAAKLAKGKYICFLNNDTCVQNGWLSSLVNKIECEPDIGLIGSKLVYTNGRIQEAGGILWCDGSAWNYGNGQISDLPEYNYLKDVDYISGASILTRKDIWEKIGGFDERYAPAYCEDADYAFEVRKAGYRVVYQPESVVVHFEGISNGKDIKKGIKKYQVENQKKFF